jgi:hypothetical protein
MDTAFPQAPYKIYLPAYAKRSTSTDINAKHTKFQIYELRTLGLFFAGIGQTHIWRKRYGQPPHNQ